MEMHDPAHPGEIVREKCLKPLGLTVTAGGRGPWRHSKALSDLLNGHTGVSPDMIDLRFAFRVNETKTVPRHRHLPRLLSHMVGLHFVAPGQKTTQSRMQSQPRVHALCAVKCGSRPLRRFGLDGAAMLGRPFRWREGRGVAARWGRCRSARSGRGGYRGRSRRRR